MRNLSVFKKRKRRRYQQTLSASGLIATGVSDPEIGPGGAGSIDENSARHVGGTAIYAFSGFETADPAAEGTVQSAGSVSCVAGGEGSGAYALRIQPTGAAVNASWILKPPSLTTGWAALSLHSFGIRFAFKVASAPSTEERIATALNTDGTLALWRLHYDPATAALNLREADGTLAASAVLADPTAWNSVEVYSIVGSPTRWWMRANGERTAAGAFATDVSDTFGALALGRHAGNANTTIAIDYDNVVIGSGLCGPVDVVVLTPIADGEQNDYSGTYADVDEIPPSATDHSDSTHDGDKMLVRAARVVADAGITPAAKLLLAVKGNWYAAESAP